MEGALGLLRVRVQKGINLVVRDASSSDPFVVVSIGNEQKLKTRVVHNNCNPEWNDELSLAIKDLNPQILLTVFDKDTFTSHDKMGDAEIDIKPYVEAMKMGLQGLPNGTVVKRVQPDRKNCLADESCIVWKDGKMIQDMFLRLRNVESGEVQIQIEWIDLPGRKSLQSS
ncbi:protein C2-DOMAIN ABA-RELATED 7-like [Impatiens glandulifera]|uniref:protein C2-DOMAIN ABA-RELATED 7-like n=1 Tax=Impatiens glandulifera TaxID=253017 RepID=UPI001FB0E0C2|nr:protein C2-DOMAIN ABA-RELATED 7-like [Impatiens glandulifera]